VKTLQDVAQAMLDRYGYFVVCRPSPVKIGTVERCEIGPGDCVDFDPLPGPFKIAGHATVEEWKAQHDLLGADLPPGPLPYYIYRAVAE
jgi:hypothetical protein